MDVGNHKQLHNLIPALFLVLGLLLVLTLGFIDNRKDNERTRLETRITAEQIKIRLESCINSRVRLIQVLAGHPWESRQQLIDTWTDPAGTLLPLFSGVQALNYIDTGWVIRVVYPAETNQAALNANLRESSSVSVISALGEAEMSSRLTRTNIVELLQSGKGFALYKKIVDPEGNALGFVNGVFRVNDLMDTCLSEKSLRNHYVFGLYEGDKLLYEQPESLTSVDATHIVNLQINVVGRPWRLAFAPLQTHLDANHHELDKLWIGLGVLLTFLLAFAVRSLLNKQKTLQENEDKYRLLVENQTDMLVKVNMRGEFQYVSPSYCEIFGKTEKELLGKQFLPLVHEDDKVATSASLDSLFHPPHTSYHEQRAMTKNGWRWLAWSNTAVMDKTGTIEAITAVGRDVTEVKSLEENIAHSQKMKAIGEMAGGITHDFNNLLQVIIGNIECLLLDGNQSREATESLEQISNVVERAMSLTQKLSTLSRQETGQRDVFDINSFLQELTTLLEHTFPASVKLSFEQYQEPLKVFADRSLIEQVVLNLCFNARDATGSSGNIKIQINKKVLDKTFLRHIHDVEPGEFCLITVEDDGCGIDPKIVSRIFDPFFTTKKSGTGTGLGLANCYSIVKQHKGLILVDSEPATGTCFFVYLPLSIAALERKERTTAPIANTVISGHKKVLVADDDAEILKLTRQTLESAGFETIGAADGKEALDLFNLHQHDLGLVVLDLVMPEMGGQEVAKNIRRYNDDIKILFVTGYIPENVTENLDEPIIRKPYKRNVFLKTVAELLGG